MQKVFLSHTGRDTEWARSFVKALKDRGVSVWFDRSDIQFGENWVEALESALRNSDVIVALLDAETPTTPNLFFELGAAIGMGKRFVPIVPEGVDLGTLPLNLRRRYLVRDTPEQTADALSATLLAA